MKNKISVITVVFNDVGHIRQTMESYFAQTWAEKEYIVIDGGSTDGTADIIREYAGKLTFWCSEKDEGIYDAMNKGISHATGDWIIVLNSGDLFAFDYSLERAITNCPDIEHADIIYGDSIERNDSLGDVYREASTVLTTMEYEPIYRHGSSLVRTDVQKSHLYATDRTDEFGFALDWHLIFTLYKEGYRFQKTDTIIELFLTEGMSDDPRKSRELNSKICGGRTAAKDKRRQRIEAFKTTGTYRWIAAFLLEYVINDILPHIPFWRIRRFTLKKLKLKIGTGSFIMKDCYIMGAPKITIGEHSHINRGCLLDGRGNICIGNNVSVSFGVCLLSGGHDHESKTFRGRFLPIRIDDNAWIGANATVLQNVRIGRGAVVCAGAVVTKDVAPYSIVGGVPAKVIGKRTEDLDYRCDGWMEFT